MKPVRQKFFEYFLNEHNLITLESDFNEIQNIMEEQTQGDEDQIIAILSNFETRSSKDIQFLMEQAFKAGKCNQYDSFNSWFDYVKREILDL